MTDAHCHVSCGDPSVREFLAGRDFFGVHPWDVAAAGARFDLDAALAGVRASLLEHPDSCVGEIGLDRLKARDIPRPMRDMFEAQLRLAVDLRRPVVLHGAKCWGQVVEAVRRLVGGDGGGLAFVFHGFSRSDGLLPEIFAMNGFVSVGPAVLNDHAVNYRALVTKIPRDRILVETDRTAENAATCPSVRDVLAKLAELRGEAEGDLEAATDENAAAARQSNL